MIVWAYHSTQQYKGMVQMRQYVQHDEIAIHPRRPKIGVLDLIPELHRRMVQWEKTITQTDSAYLAEKAPWVKKWLQSEGRDTVNRAMSEASLQSQALINTLDHKVEAVLEVCNALESVSEESEEKYDALLDWVLEIPGILMEHVQEQSETYTAIQPKTVYTSDVEVQIPFRTTHVVAS